MSRESPGKRTLLRASRTCCWVTVGAMSLLLFEAFVRGADDRNRLVSGGDDRDHVHVRGTDEAAADHGLAHPVDETGPHCTHQDERMLLHVLDLQELPDHEQLQSGSNATGKDDERRGEPDEVMQPREEGAVPEDFVDEWVRSLLRGHVDGQTERAGVALDLAFDRAGIGRLHQARPAAGHDVYAHARQLEAEAFDLLIDWIAAADAGAAADRDAVS